MKKEYTFSVHRTHLTSYAKIKFVAFVAFFQGSDSPLECSSTGRTKRKSRQEMSYRVFFSDNEDEVQDYLKKHDNNRFVLFKLWHCVH